MLSSFLKSIFRKKREDRHFYLVLYRGSNNDIAECIMSNRELANMLLRQDPRIISLSPAVSVSRDVVRQEAAEVS